MQLKVSPAIYKSGSKWQSRLWYSSSQHSRWLGGLFSLASVGLATAAMFWIDFAPFNVNMVYMLLTLVATIWFGLASGVLTAFLGFLAFDFYFIPPYFTFAIDALQGWTAAILFLVTALFANQVAGRSRLSSQQAQERERQTQALYELARLVITKIDQTEMLTTITRQVSLDLKANVCVLYLATEDKLAATVSVENGQIESQRHPDIAWAQAVYSRHSPSFLRDEATLAGRPVAYAIAYLPLLAGSGALGVLAVVQQEQNLQFEWSSDQQHLLTVFANHVALAVEHARLIQENVQVEALRDSDKLKTSLLASVSHELRTPLTSIKASADSLLDENVDWPEKERHEFISLIGQETDRLARLVSNLLDLSKIEAGVLKPDFGWHFLPEILEQVVARLEANPVVAAHPITTRYPADLPLVRLDYLQIDQVLTNLIENAAKYSPPGQPISIEIQLQGQPDQPEFVVQVLDEGPGLPASELERVFDKFYRVRPDSEALKHVSGTGIGLAISRGIVEAHGGRIWAQNRLYGGAIFSFTLPYQATPDEDEI